MDSKALFQLLERTDLFHEALSKVLGNLPSDSSTRGKLTTLFLALAERHWLSLRVLMGSGLPHSAIPLMRLQSEATVKAFWVRFAAGEPWLEKVARQKVKDGRPLEPKWKSMAELLDDLGKTAHPLIGVQLTEFRDSNLRPLHAFIHSGVLALSTLSDGLPERFCCQMVRIATGLASLSATLTAEMSCETTGEAEARYALAQVQLDFLDCLPRIREAEEVDALMAGHSTQDGPGS